jgi:hypothetical protein
VDVHVHPARSEWHQPARALAVSRCGWPR